MIENRVRMSIVGVDHAGPVQRAVRPALVPPGGGVERVRRGRPEQLGAGRERAADPRPDPRRQGPRARRQPHRQRHHDRPQALGREAAAGRHPARRAARPARGGDPQEARRTNACRRTPRCRSRWTSPTTARVRERAPRGLPRRARRAARDPSVPEWCRSAAHVLGYVGEINEAELTAQPPCRRLQAR